MYAGNTIPTEWPTRADQFTYEEYAKQPSWHVEEAASLAAGFVPRAPRNLNYRPLHDEPKESRPYDGAKTWGALINGGPIGELISLFARYKKVHEWNFSTDSLYIPPLEFIDFCAQFDIQVPVDLTEAVQSRSTRKPAKDASPLSNEERCYRDAILRLANELAPRAAGNRGRLTLDQLHELVGNDTDCRGLKVDTRTIEKYLAKMREDESVRILLAKILRSAKGKPSDQDKDDLRRWLPTKVAKILRLN
jgi:hypothetical protein